MGVVGRRSRISFRRRCGASSGSVLALLVLGCGESSEHEPAREAAKAEPCRVASYTRAGDTVLARLEIDVAPLHESKSPAASAQPADSPETTPSSLIDELTRLRDLVPRLVLTPKMSVEEAVEADALSALGVAVIEVAPLDLPEALQLYRNVAFACGRRDAYARFSEEVELPIGRISAARLGMPRPLFAPLRSLSPLVVDAGHSFSSSIIEIAGGESMTHGTDSPRRLAAAEELASANVEAAIYFVEPGADRAATHETEISDRFAALGIELFVIETPIDSVWLTAPLPVVAEVAEIVVKLDEKREATRLESAVAEID